MKPVQGDFYMSHVNVVFSQEPINQILWNYIYVNACYFEDFSSSKFLIKNEKNNVLQKCLNLNKILCFVQIFHRYLFSICYYFSGATLSKHRLWYFSLIPHKLLLNNFNYFIYNLISSLSHSLRSCLKNIFNR